MAQTRAEMAELRRQLAMMPVPIADSGTAAPDG
jgi:hypothetical protein